jgi:hypothetical protein
VNPAFRVGTAKQASRARVLNDFSEFTPGTSSALTRCDSHNASEGGTKDMKRTGTLAIILGSALLAGVANAAVPAAEDVQAPRAASQDIQAPRAEREDLQAPRARSEDLQAPRTESQDIQAPRG